VCIRDTYSHDRAGTLRAATARVRWAAMFNKVGAVYMFLMAIPFLALAWGQPGSEEGPWWTPLWLVFAFGFVGLGIWLLHQR